MSDYYRYAFNGQEKDDEVSGAGNSNTAMYWQYDTRLGRRWNMDPKTLTPESPYICFGDNPIVNIDPNGDFKTKFRANLYNFLHGGGGTVKEQTKGTHKGQWAVITKVEVKDNTDIESEIITRVIEINGVKVVMLAPVEVIADKYTYNWGEDYSKPSTGKSAWEDIMDGPDFLSGTTGKWTGSASNSSLEGEKGLKAYSKGLSNTGTALSLTPLAPIGKVLSAGSDLINTGLDFKNKDASTALSNLAVRLVATVVGETVGKALKGVGAKKDVGAVVGAAISKGKEALTD